MAALATALALGACALVPPLSPEFPGAALSGRLAVRVDGSDGAAPRALNADFELQGGAQAGQLNLSTPLGNRLAQARWASGSVVLATPQGERRFPDLDALSTEVIGESLPIAALFDWLRGRPWPGAPSTPLPASADAGFTQLGWVVSLAGFAQQRVDATRERAPVVTVRARLDR